MDLPPEIRNQIYSYLFPPQRVLIDRHKLTHPRPHYRLHHNQISPREPETQKLKCRPHNKCQRKFPTQLSLPFVSRQSYMDTLCLLYDSTQFVFTSPKCLSSFLKNVPKQAQEVIRHIELKHTMNNEPTLSRFRELKFRGDRNWYSLCGRIVTSFTALKVVHIDLGVFDAPIALEIGESWSLPILVLQKVKGQAGKKREGGKGALDFARVRLRSGQFSKEAVRKVERQLEMELMDPVKVQMRKDEKLARQLAGNRKATKVLRLVVK
ncbi:hypothetical protein BDV12DRAFT_135694 [Aspergillus spectabilis]